MSKNKSLAEEMQLVFNTRSESTKAKSFTEEEALLQIDSWITLKPFFKEGTGGNGFPCGHITQIIGKPDSGKTTLLMEGMISCQKAGGVVFFIDSEHKFSLPRFASMGGIVKDLKIIQPDTLEDAWTTIHNLCNTIEEFRKKGQTAPILLCWDSVSASVPKKVKYGEAGDHHIGVEAKINNKNVRRLRGWIKEVNLACVFINHYYMTQPKTPYEHPVLVIKGGEELEFFSTLIIKTKQGAKIERDIKGEKQKLGRITRFEVHKGHYHGRTIVKDVYVVDRGILETKEELEEYKKSIRGDF